jgi:hypothetical protein
MADTRFTQPNAPLTAESFHADRMSFWHSVTKLTTKTAAALVFFCAWLWWCSAGGFTLFHSLALPVVVGLIFLFL